MSSETSNNDDKSYNKLTPVTETMHAITWDGNNATIMGTLLKIQEWVTRTGHFRLFIEHGAVRVGHYTMIDHTDAIEFLQKEYKDPIKRTITNICRDSCSLLLTAFCCILVHFNAFNKISLHSILMHF